MFDHLLDIMHYAFITVTYLNLQQLLLCLVHGENMIPGNLNNSLQKCIQV